MKKTNKIISIVIAVAMIFGMMSVIPVVGNATEDWYTGNYVGLAMSSGSVYVSDGFNQWAYGGESGSEVKYNPYVVYSDSVTANAIKVVVDSMPSDNLTGTATVYVDSNAWSSTAWATWDLSNATAVSATLSVDGNILTYAFSAEVTGKTFCVIWGTPSSTYNGGSITFSTNNVKAGMITSGGVDPGGEPLVVEPVGGWLTAGFCGGL